MSMERPAKVDAAAHSGIATRDLLPSGFYLAGRIKSGSEEQRDEVIQSIVPIGLADPGPVGPPG